MSTVLVDQRPSGVEPAAAPVLESAGIPTTPARIQPGGCVRLVSLLSAIALIPMIIAHVIGASVVNPFTDPISWYAFVPGGAALIMIGGSILALLGALITIRMYQGGLAAGPLPAIMMAIFCAAMIMVGVVHTVPDAALQHVRAVTETHGAMIGATIHRISAGAAFAVLPVVGLLITRSISRPRTGLPRLLRRAAYLLAVLVGVFLSIHLPLAFAGSGIAAFGFLERAGFVVMIGYLFLLARVIDCESPGPPAIRR